MAPQSYTLYDLLVHNADCLGNELAVVDEDGHECTYHALLDRVDALAAGLAQRGLGHGDRISILAQNSATYFDFYFACAKNGHVAYPINWRWSTEEIERMLERAGAKAFITDSSSLEKVPASVAEDGALVLRGWIGKDTPSGYTNLASLYANEPQERGSVDPDDDFTVIATAAVDVIPRGALLTHANVLASSAQQIAAMGLVSSDRNLLALPLFHIAGLGNALAIVQAGGANIVMPKFDPARAVELIERWQITYLSDFPPVLTSVLDAAKEADTRLPSLRYVSGLDAPATMERLHAETDADFWTGFGQTETSGFVSFQRVKDRANCAGKPGNLSSVKLVDDNDTEVAVETPGEIIVRGPIVFAGYDGLPEVTEYTFRNGWHHTGDIGRFDVEGNLYYVARKPEKELIKPGGENVYPAEVETVILELEGVNAVCVFGVPDEKWGEAIKAIVETTSDSLDAAAIREHVGSRIARFKRPQHVEFTDRLARREDDSIDREKVKETWSNV